MKRIKNYFTVDLEEWWSYKIFPGFNPDKSRDYIIESTIPLLKLLDKYNIKATFFVLGRVIEKYQKLIKEIHRRGHDIESHGYNHKLLHKMTPEEFEKDIIKCKKLTYKVIKKYPKGFRAPSYSLSNRTRWALPILKKHGFTYDSSILPYKFGDYGVSFGPKRPYKIDFNDVRKIKDCGMTEYPLQITHVLGIPFMVVGGFYFRFYPVWLINYLIKSLNKKGIVINFFIHPWDLNKNTPRTKMSLFGRFVTYYGLKRSFKKLKKILKKHKFGPIQHGLK